MNDRADQTHQARRRRSNSYNGYDLRLDVSNELKDPNYEYRWINDDRGRLQARTESDDWDFVEDANLAIATEGKNKNESESRIRREVGVSSVGKPLYAYLCRKRKDWYEDDMRKQHDLNLNRQKQVIHSQDAGGEGTLSNEDPRHSYVPENVKSSIDVTERVIRRAGRPKIRDVDNFR